MQRENPFPKNKKVSRIRQTFNDDIPTEQRLVLPSGTHAIHLVPSQTPPKPAALTRSLALAHTHTHTPPAAAPVRQRVWKNSLLFNAEFHLQNPLGGTRKRFPGAGDDFRHTLAQLWTHGKTLKWPRRAISRTDKLHVSRWLLLTQNTFRTDGRRRQGWQIDGVKMSASGVTEMSARVGKFHET